MFLRSPLAAALLLLLLDYSTLIATKTVVLLDTTTKSRLDWDVSSLQDTEDGWVEETYTDIPNGYNWRSYVVCDVVQPQVDNWLFSPYLARADAQRLAVEVVFTMRDCRLFPHAAQTCKETFGLHMLESDGELADLRNRTFRVVDRIAADQGRYSSFANVIRNNETRHVAVSKKGIYIGFRDEGACLTLLSIRVYYEVCEELVANFARFAETPTGSDVFRHTKVTGVCVANSVPTDKQPKLPVYYCRADGNWDISEGSCTCDSGYEAVGQNCLGCPLGSYKFGPGGHKCEICPSNSRSAIGNSSFCPCQPHFFRAPREPITLGCTRPPTRPRNPKAQVVNSNSAVIQWESPVDSGGRGDVSYRLLCSGNGLTSGKDEICPSTAVHYQPAKSQLNSTKVTLTNLMPGTTYTFLIVAENGVSTESQEIPQYAAVTFTTDTLTGLRVDQFRADAATHDSVTLSWQGPELITDKSSHSGSGHNCYEIRYFSRQNAENVSNIQVCKTTLTISGLKPGVEYGFQIRLNTVALGQGLWSELKFVKTHTADAQLPTPVMNMKAIRIYAILAACLLLLLMLIVTIWLCLRRSHKSNRRPPSDLESLEYKNELLNTSLTSGSLRLTNSSDQFASPLLPVMAAYGTRITADPLCYEDPNDLQLAAEINPDLIVIEEIFATGQFGEVCRGSLQLPNGLVQPVAIKTLKPGSNEVDRGNFLREAFVMAHFHHPNIIRLCGIVSKLEPFMIVTEFMANKSLDAFIKSHGHELSIGQLVKMLEDVASGMCYLSEVGYVHRDLAARNILIDAGLTCKISDFGLSRTLDCPYYETNGVMPIRWSSPEAIQFRKFSAASDVWSFGVLIWELMSGGDRPFWDWSNQEVVKAVGEGFRLPRPADCPPVVHNLMLLCWDQNPACRPSFRALLVNLSQILRHPETLDSHSDVNPYSTVNLTGTYDRRLSNRRLNSIGRPPVIPNVDAWLTQLGFEQYRPLFYSHNIVDEIADLFDLSVMDFVRMGITNVRHAEKMVEHLKNLKSATLRRGIAKVC